MPRGCRRRASATSVAASSLRELVSERPEEDALAAGAVVAAEDLGTRLGVPDGKGSVGGAAQQRCEDLGEHSVVAWTPAADARSGSVAGVERPGVIGRWVPGVELIRHRRGAGLRRDVIAGVVLAALLVPQGLAYAGLAGLPPIAGLYATLVPLVVYFLLGPSRILIISPDSAVCPLVAAAVVPLAAPGDAAQRIEFAGMLAVIVGLIMFAGGLARFGFITELLSVPVRLGYLAGIAATVLVAQLPKLFGFSAQQENFIPAVRDFASRLGETNGTALALGVASLVLIVVLRRVAPRLPGVLLAVVGATAVVAVFGLADEVKVVGDVPAGLPSFNVPDVTLDNVEALIGAAVGVAFVAFADTSVLSKSYAARLRQKVDQNQELAALGAANVAVGLFQGFPVSSSGSRTAVAEDAGAGSQFAGLAAAVTLGVLLIVGMSLVHDLPAATLAAIVIVAILGLVDIRGARRLLAWRPSEFALMVVTFAGVAVLGVLWGVGIAIAISLLLFIQRAWRPHDARLGRVDNLKGYHDAERHPEAQMIPGLALYRFDAPLFFANAEHFHEHVRELAADEGTSWVLVAAEPITDVDTTAGEMLRELHDELAADDVVLAFAELKGPARDRLRRYGIEAAIGAERFYPTIGAAVSSYLRASGVQWLDWEERAGRADGDPPAAAPRRPDR